ncbi:hypothetical protein [Bifidobacterium saguinibicoloris]|uniref:hypothetical protein n=1 Tax=Bifidobacterium saguinibicoloris TaxID=2834433 RepID=UPI001C5A36E0|nr:hypothetical protein [Bifidobacterium saguinibicoloris]MBW3079887.1 hypothetical protein [Bifidobacterium saguinibicoloris]
MANPEYDRAYLETCGNDKLSELYMERFGEWYPCNPYGLTIKIYAGCEEDPDFRQKAINALISGKTVQPPSYELDPDDIY